MKFFLNLAFILFIVSFRRKTLFCGENTLKVLLVSLILFGSQFIHSQTIDSIITQKENIVYVGSEIDYPPYCMVDAQGNPEGFSVDLFKAVAKEMNLNIKFKTGIWSTLKDDLKEGSIDALPLVGRTPEREEIFDFTFPYLTMHGCILIRNDVTDISTLEDLTGKKVAVLKGDNSEEFVNRIKLNATIFSTNSYADAIKDLSENKYDAVIIQKMVALEILKELQITNLKIVTNPLYEFKQEFCFAVTENNSDLLSLLNEGLAIISHNGIFDALYKKWFFAFETEKFRKLTVVVGGDDSYPPYEFIDETGKPSGYNVDLTKAIAKEIGLIVDIKLGSWSQVKSDLDVGKLDIVQGMFYSDERAKVYSLSQAHTRVGHVMVSRKGLHKPVDLNNLIDSTIVVMSDDLMYEYLTDNGFKNIITVNSQEKALRLVSEGIFNYAFVARLPALYWINKYEWENLVISEQSILSPEYCYAALKENEKLLEMITEGLKAIKETGEYRNITSKWFGVYDNDVYDYKKILKYSIYILIVFAILIIVIFIWSNTLRRQVDKRTKALNNEIDKRISKENLLRLTNEELANAKARAEESETKFRIVFKESNSIQLLIEPQTGKIIDVNQAACEFYGYSYPELVSLQIQDINQLSEKEIEKEMQKAKSRNLNYFEFKHKLSNGTIKDVEVYSKPIIIDNETLLISIIHDITVRNLAEQKLIIAKAKAEESDRLKSAFLANMSHEIRTPMNGILGFTDLLKEADLSGKERGKYIEVTERSGVRMLNTINDIIDISRIESGEVVAQSKTTNINAQLEFLYDFFKPEAEKKNIKLSFKPGLYNNSSNIQTDPEKFDAIFTNLIKNALKFTHEGYIEFGYKAMDKEIHFYTKDSGEGIESDNLESIFERFIQEDDSYTKTQQGSGLGLSIVKAYVELLGGKIWLESKKGEGSTFHFTLPYKAMEIETTNSELKVEETLDRKSSFVNKTILIVEDDDASYEYLKVVIKSFGITNIYWANNGKKAIKLCKDKPAIDMVLMDINMPAMNGYEATKAIKTFRPDLPIIAQTAYALSGDREKSLEAGCDDYIKKPVKREKLFVKIEKFFD